MTATASLFRTGRHFEDELSEIPNPKPTQADKARFGSLASLYTAFSLDFAKALIEMCLRAGCSRLADPFSGTGTLGEAGRAFPVLLHLGDISPFAALSGAFRSAPVESIFDAVELLEQISRRVSAPNERKFFEKVFVDLEARTKVPVGASLDSPSTPKHLLPSITIYLAALSRIRLYKRLAGSNPTWVKRPDCAADIASTREAVRATSSIAREFARKLPALHPANRTTCTWSSIERLRIEPGAIDAIVTSPPYANRTDYIRHYLPGSEMLLDLVGMDERSVRAEQIGTPLIRDSHSNRAFTSSVINVLERIRTHGSYASERYYYKGFLYYFADMYSAMARMRVWLRRRGLLLMVVQDTYYKDIHIPTASLLLDLAESLGYTIQARRDWPVRQYLSRLSPHSRRAMAKNSRTLRESVVILSK